MKVGDLLKFDDYSNTSCEKPVGWEEIPVTIGTVIEVYGYENEYWACDIMWPDGTVDNVELHELEYEIVNEGR